MKTIALVLVLVAAASAQIGGSVGRAPATGGGVGGGHPRNWGPKVYGPGANNPYAFPPNPILMQRALTIVNSVPNALIFLDVTGEISFTDRYGREADIIHASGIDLGDLIEF